MLISGAFRSVMILYVVVHESTVCFVGIGSVVLRVVDIGFGLLHDIAVRAHLPEKCGQC